MPDRGHMTRETQVMILASEGFTDKQIASYLGISADTVSTYWRRILARFGAASRTEVIAKMVQQQAAEAISNTNKENRNLKAEIEQRAIAEQQLAANTERLSLLMDGIDTGVLFLTEDMLILYTNKAFCEIFELEQRPHELVGEGAQLLTSVMPAILEDNKAFQDRTSELFERGESVKADRIALANGKIIERSYEKIKVDDASFGHLLLHRDVTNIIRANESLQYQSDFSKLLSNIAPHMIGATDGEQETAINYALSQVGQFAGVDRSYIFRFNFETQTMSCTNEWCEKGISAEIDNLKHLPMNVFPWFMNQIMEGKAIVVQDVQMLGDEAKSERDSFTEQGIHSLIAMPLLSSESDALGFIGFDSVRAKRNWDAKISEVLMPLSNMVSAISERGTSIKRESTTAL
jgi:DNA-binding CsgD family transcriptional regulator